MGELPWHGLGRVRHGRHHLAPGAFVVFNAVARSGSGRPHRSRDAIGKKVGTLAPCAVADAAVSFESGI